MSTKVKLTTHALRRLASDKPSGVEAELIDAAANYIDELEGELEYSREYENEANALARKHAASLNKLLFGNFDEAVDRIVAYDCFDNVVAEHGRREIEEMKE